MTTRDDQPLARELLALELALVCFPRPRRQGAGGLVNRNFWADASMYTLQKAKEEIDAVARHATDIAVHAITVAEDMDVKLERFKTELLSAIDEKFAKLGRSIRGDGEPVESTAISDLGAKVSLLSRPRRRRTRLMGIITTTRLIRIVDGTTIPIRTADTTIDGRTRTSFPERGDAALRRFDP